jgi:hypothetical protein
VNCGKDRGGPGHDLDLAVSRPVDPKNLVEPKNPAEMEDAVTPFIPHLSLWLASARK